MRQRPTAGQDEEEGIVQLSLDLRLFGRQKRVRGEAPNRPVRPRHLLPLFRELTTSVIEAGEEESARKGNSVSCRAGCVFCCHQLVPLTHTEAHALRDLVEDLPLPQRRATERRFRDVKKRIAEAGLLDDLLDDENLASDEAFTALSHRYFDAVVPCPFLENDLCSIYADRPLTCREYLVTTPPEACRTLDASIERLPLPAEPSRALAHIDGGRRAWVPLPLAIDWANANPDLAEPKSAPETVDAFARLLQSSKSSK